MGFGEIHTPPDATDLLPKLPLHHRMVRRAVCARRRHHRNRISLGTQGATSISWRSFRLIKREAGLTVINDVSLEEYVTSVISSEMSASCPSRNAESSRGDFAQLAVVSEGESAAYPGKSKT